MGRHEKGESPLKGPRQRIKGLKEKSNDNGEETQTAQEPQGQKGRVTEPKKGLYEDVDRAKPPAKWNITDDIQVEADGTKVITSAIEAEGKSGYVERAYNPVTKKLEMRNAFLEDLPKWVNEGTPMVDGKGTPTVTWLTLRQMKMLGIDCAGLKSVKRSTIQNVKAIIQLHVLRMREVKPNDAVLQTHSVQYAETTIVQSGHKVVSAEVKGNTWEKPLSFLLDHDETNDPALKSVHDQLIKDFGEGQVTRDTKVWMNYDIDMKVAPFEGPK